MPDNARCEDPAVSGGSWGDYIGAGPFREYTEDQLGNLVMRPGEHVTVKSDYQVRVDTEELERLSELMADAGTEYGLALMAAVPALAETAMLWTRMSSQAAQAERLLAEAVGSLQGLWVDGPEFALKLTTARQSYLAAEEYAKGLAQAFERIYSSTAHLTAGLFSSTVLGGFAVGAAGLGLVALDAHLRGTSRAGGTVLGALQVDLGLVGSVQARAELEQRRRGFHLARLERFRRLSPGHPVLEQVSGGFETAARPRMEYLARQVGVAGTLDSAHDRSLGEDQSQVHDGLITVQKILRKDGSCSFVVAVPGTDFDTVEGGKLLNGQDGPNSFGTMIDNFAADPEAGIEQSSALVQMIDRALEQAGAGTEDPVVMAGFSQGGMAVMSAVGTRALTEKYNVTAAVTFGSPTQQYRNAPEGVAITHLKDVNDGVSTDVPGKGAGAERAQVIRFSSRHRGIGFDAHDIQNYREAASRIDPTLSSSAEGRRLQEALDQALPEGAAVETQVYVSSASFYDRPDAGGSDAGGPDAGVRNSTGADSPDAEAPRMRLPAPRP